MTKAPETPDLINDHREALALALFEEAQKINLGVSLDEFRGRMNSLELRCKALEAPSVRARYVQIRGFDPKEQDVAPKLRWIGTSRPVGRIGTSPN